MKSSTPLTEGNQATLASQKYQKAIKEINKLILINTTTKKELISLQEKYNSLQIKYSQLQQQLLSLGKETIQKIQDKQLPKMARTVVSNSQANQINIDQGQRFTDDEKNSKQVTNQLSGPNKSLKNTDTVNESIDTKKKYEQYELKIVEKDKKIEEMIKQLGQKNKENTQLYEKCIELMNNKVNAKKEENNKKEVQNLEEQKMKLENKLQQREEFIKQLSSQVLLLKKKQVNMLKLSFCRNQNASKNQNSDNIDLQNKQTEKLKNVQTMKNIQGLKSSSKVQQIKFDPFTEHYARKIQELEEYIQKITKQFNCKRQKYKTKISFLESQNQKLGKFTKKQQSFIQNFVNKNDVSKQEKALTINKSEIFLGLQVDKINSKMQKSQMVGMNCEPDLNRQKQEYENYDSSLLVPCARVKTMESEQSPAKRTKPNINLSFSNQKNHRFIKGTKHYNN